MMQPAGDRSPSVYWRRRILVFAALALAVASVYAVFFHGGGSKKTAAQPTPTQTTGAPGSTSAAATSTGATASSSSTPSSSAPPRAQACLASQLTLGAATDAPSYKVGDRPRLALVVTNNGPQSCVSDLADARIELRVFSGSARVWGSHDCAIAPGVSEQTLPVGRPIRRDIEWSGLSSQTGCKGTRARVSAGSYTLFALLSGQQGKSVRFSITG